mmetsp:Transcript_6903/g.22783  ORF Transcript_6903/g.22783 Transcript_6903/m.22783 type:complete len:204 (-) Transcript_6903:157-768(-)
MGNAANANLSAPLVGKSARLQPHCIAPTRDRRPPHVAARRHAPTSSGKPTEKRSRVGSSCLPSPSRTTIAQTRVVKTGSGCTWCVRTRLVTSSRTSPTLRWRKLKAPRSPARALSTRFLIPRRKAAGSSQRCSRAWRSIRSPASSPSPCPMALKRLRKLRRSRSVSSTTKPACERGARERLATGGRREVAISACSRLRAGARR